MMPLFYRIGNLLPPKPQQIILLSVETISFLKWERAAILMLVQITTLRFAWVTPPPPTCRKTTPTLRTSIRGYS